MILFYHVIFYTIIEGSTNFVSVFQTLGKMFRSKDHDNTKSYFIFFMTDGEDTVNNEKEIMAAKEKLQTDIEESGTSAIVHVLGFSDSHDEQFLESLTFIGVQDGTYSFISPKEGDKALEEHILSLIKSVSSFVGRNVSVEVLGENIEFLGEKYGEERMKKVTLPAVMSKTGGKMTVSTKKFVRITDQSEPKFQLIFHDNAKDDTGKAATVKEIKIVDLDKDEDIVNHNLIKLRTAMNQLMKENEDGNENQELIKKEYEAIEESFKNLQINDSASSTTKRRKEAVTSGLKLLKDIYDPEVVSFDNKMALDN